MSNQFVCITGAERGIGLALTREWLEAGCTVFAGSRTEHRPELDRLALRFPGCLHPFVLDVGSDASVREAAAWIRGRTDRLDLLINNAAILGDTKQTVEDEIDFEEIRHVYNVSALGAIRMSNALIEPVMNGGKLIVMISSEAGSIGNSYREAWFGYCMAKASLNMGSTIIHNKIRERGGRVLLLHPGWVKTSMSGTWDAAGTYTPEQSAVFIVQRIRDHGGEIHDQPLYMAADTGKLLPW